MDSLTTDGRLLLPNKHLVERIQLEAADGKQGGWSAGTTEIDSHENMVVIGLQVTTVQDTGKFSDVNAYKKHELLAIPK